MREIGTLRRRLALASLVAVAFANVALLNAPTADARKWRSCGDQKRMGAGYLNVYARNVGCKKARAVAYEWTWGGGFETGEARGFTCSDRRIGYELSKVRCVNSPIDGATQVVKFQAGA